MPHASLNSHHLGLQQIKRFLSQVDHALPSVPTHTCKSNGSAKTNQQPPFLLFRFLSLSIYVLTPPPPAKLLILAFLPPPLILNTHIITTLLYFLHTAHAIRVPGHNAPHHRLWHCSSYTLCENQSLHSHLPDWFGLPSAPWKLAPIKPCS
jgi:hypothetical protein